MSGLGLVGKAEPSHRKSMRATGLETKSLYRVRMEKTGEKTKKTDGSNHASAGKGCITQAPNESDGGTCGGSDLHCAHAGVKREGRVWTCRVCVGVGAAT